MTTNDPISTSSLNTCAETELKDGVKSKCHGKEELQKERIDDVNQENDASYLEKEENTVESMKKECSYNKVKDIEQLIIEAKNAMGTNDFEKAAIFYADALELLVPPGADPFRLSLAPVYYSYGISLLNAYVSQNQLLSHEIPNEISVSENETEPVGRKKIIQFDTLNEKDEYEEGEDTAKEGSLSAQEDADQNRPSSSSTSYLKSQVYTDGDDEGIDLLHAEEEQINEILNNESMNPDNEVEDDLQLAWEVLDTARVIYTKNNSGERAMSLLLADVNIALGDVGLESENFSTAFDDYKSGLQIKQQWLEPIDRSIAELYYKMALALELDKKGSAAVQYVQSALDLLNGRAERLKKQLASFIDTSDDVSSNISTEKERLAAELEDLENLTPDLLYKIDELKKSVADDSLSNGSSSDAVPKTGVDGAEAVTDITSLVRKKEKKRDDESLQKRAEDITDSSSIEVGSSSKKAKI